MTTAFWVKKAILLSFWGSSDPLEPCSSVTSQIFGHLENEPLGKKTPPHSVLSTTVTWVNINVESDKWGQSHTDGIRKRLCTSWILLTPFSQFHIIIPSPSLSMVCTTAVFKCLGAIFFFFSNQLLKSSFRLNKHPRIDSATTPRLWGQNERLGAHCIVFSASPGQCQIGLTPGQNWHFYWHFVMMFYWVYFHFFMLGFPGILVCCVPLCVFTPCVFESCDQLCPHQSILCPVLCPVLFSSLVMSSCCSLHSLGFLGVFFVFFFPDCLFELSFESFVCI